MKSILVKDILRECNGELICGNENEICESFSKDTREIKTGDIYLGIKGERFNGSNFYKQAFENGAKGCILQDIKINEEDIKECSDKFIIVVDNVVEAIQVLAKYKRSLYNIPVIGVTGSVGKTSTKDLIASVLSKEFNVLKTEGNYNNEIGLPLTILKLKDHNAMVLEMGMSAFGEISLLTNIAKPTTAVITIIGSSHIGELGSRENILKAKLEILEGLAPNGSLIINNDNDLLNMWNRDNKDKHKHITYAIENKSDLNATNVEILENSSVFEIELNKKKYKVEVPVGGKHFVYNSLAAIAVGLEYNIDIENIIKGIKTFSLTKRRMEILQTKDNATIINDSYNASYESTKAALEYLNSVKADRKIAVLGDVLELGKFSKQMHELIGEEVVKNNVNILITVGTEAQNINNIVKDKNIEEYSFKTNEEAIKKLQGIIKPKDIVLVKASNGMHFEEIVDAIK